MFFETASMGFSRTLESLAYLYNHVDLPKIKPVRGKKIVCVKCGGGYGSLRKLPCGDYVCGGCFKNGGVDNDKRRKITGY